jgi:Ca2+-dependent lipid-binding protein
MIEKLTQSVKAQVPNVRHKVEPPAFVDGIWNIDFTNGTQGVAVEIISPKTIGVSVLPGDWGSNADEHFSTPEEAAARTIQLLRKVA